MFSIHLCADICIPFRLAQYWRLCVLRYTCFYFYKRQSYIRLYRAASYIYLCFYKLSSSPEGSDMNAKHLPVSPAFLHNLIFASYVSIMLNHSSYTSVALVTRVCG